MPEVLFSTMVHHGAAGARIECAGELDISTSQLLSDALEEALGRSPENLHIDLTNTTFFAGVGGDLLFELLARCNDAGIILEVSASSQVRRVLDLMSFPVRAVESTAPRSSPGHHRFTAKLRGGSRAGGRTGAPSPGAGRDDRTE